MSLNSPNRDLNSSWHKHKIMILRAQWPCIDLTFHWLLRKLLRVWKRLCNPKSLGSQSTQPRVSFHCLEITRSNPDSAKAIHQKSAFHNGTKPFPSHLSIKVTLANHGCLPAYVEYFLPVNVTMEFCVLFNFATQKLLKQDIFTQFTQCLKGVFLLEIARLKWIHAS